jgi:hypothetical protein
MYTILYPELEAKVHAPQVRSRAAQPGLGEEADHMHDVAGARTMRIAERVATPRLAPRVFTSAANPAWQAIQRLGWLAVPLRWWQCVLLLRVGGSRKSGPVGQAGHVALTSAARNADAVHACQ